MLTRTQWGDACARRGRSWRFADRTRGLVSAPSPPSTVQYAGADDSYYDDGTGGGGGDGAYAYDEYATDYEAGNGDGFEMAPVSSGAGRFGGWFGRGKSAPAAGAIEW